MIAWLEKRFGRFAVPNLMLYVIVGQIAVVVFLLARNAMPQAGAPAVSEFSLIPAYVQQGEIWRVVTFLIDMPVNVPLLFLPFYWMILHMIGNALEGVWGVFRLNMFVLLGWVLTLVATFVAYPFDRNMVATNFYLYTSLFLAFARHYPDMEFRLMLLLPIKVKWLAYMYWATLFIKFYTEGWGTRALVITVVINYLAFFWRDHLRGVKDVQRRKRFESKVGGSKGKLVHACHTCGLTSKEAPRTSFRYCSQCAGQVCYCPDHIRNHEHVVAR